MSMAGYDAWLTTDTEGERHSQESEWIVAYHEDMGHPDTEDGECPLCDEWVEHWDEGEDPDDINDRRREDAEDRAREGY